MQTLENPTVILDTILKLREIPNGTPVTLRCHTSSADIFSHATNGTPTAVQLREIPYEITGRFQGIEYPDDPGTGVTYALVLLKGEAAVLNVSGKVVGTEVRLKTAHVPLWAINKIMQH